MDNPNAKLYLGLGKVLFNSSVCLLRPTADRPDVEIFLSERFTRRKADGTWPEIPLKESGIMSYYGDLAISENRDVKTPIEKEEELNSVIPFFDYLKKNKFDRYSSALNPKVNFVSHHLAHAHVAKFMSPYENCLILVLDGAGSEGPVVQDQKGSKKEHEEASLYHLNNGELTLVEKSWQKFEPARNCEGRWYSNGIGTAYEMIAEFIFNSKRAAGKVMGLAAFGTALRVQSTRDLLESLDWNNSFKGSTKDEWESSKNLKLYKDLAATIQGLYEKELFEKLHKAKELVPNVNNLILIGGCALNCVANQKVLDNQIVKSLYCPPNPGDEGISLGCALHEYYKSYSWSPFSFEKQHGYFGPKKSVEDLNVEEVFNNFQVVKVSKPEEIAAELIEKKEVIAWFQGRSESGPRALGNRSILARIDNKGLKDYLNKSIKFRESFRPYGASFLEENADVYFCVHKDVPNPFMSFAVPVKEEYQESLKEICHIDGTSRIQTVSLGQNKKFYRLIKKVGEKTGIYGVLNTSLNVMGEPILETIEDAKRFMEKSEIRHLIIGDYHVSKRQVT